MQMSASRAAFWRSGHAAFIFCATWLTASGAVAQSDPPDYIRADPRPAVAAFGAERTQKIFSHAYTPTRQQAVMRSANSVRGFTCPSGSPMTLVQVVPYRIKADLDSWIERYVIPCTPAAQRNFLLVLDNVQPQMIELLPGSTIADPLLQRDTIVGATSSVLAAKPGECANPQIVDTAVSTYPKDRSAWIERWSFDLCGVKAAIDLTFTPSLRGGVDWTAQVVKD